MKKMWHVNIMEYCSVIKGVKILPCTVIQMEPEDIVVSGTNIKYSCSHVGNKEVDFIEMENRIKVSSARGKMEDR